MRKLLITSILCLTAVTIVSAHDLFLKLDTYFLDPNSRTTVRLMNGTFLKSDGVVRRERMRVVSLVMPGIGLVDTWVGDWSDAGETSLLSLRTSDAGTYLVAVSIKPRMIELKSADFNRYLEHDGIPDILAQRKERGELKRNVREQYSKHARAVLQVGGRLTDSYKVPPPLPSGDLAATESLCLKSRRKH
ncbi:MAG: hypothetical protein AB1898_10900 [Acidobacteriota bacterium]